MVCSGIFCTNHARQSLISLTCTCGHYQTSQDSQQLVESGVQQGSHQKCINSSQNKSAGTNIFTNLHSTFYLNTLNTYYTRNVKAISASTAQTRYSHITREILVFLTVVGTWLAICGVTLTFTYDGFLTPDVNIHIFR